MSTAPAASTSAAAPLGGGHVGGDAADPVAELGRDAFDPVRAASVDHDVRAGVAEASCDR